MVLVLEFQVLFKDFGKWNLQFLIKRLYSSFFLRVPVREYPVNGTPPFRKLRFGEWFVKFGPKLELMCFKNSVHLGAEKYLHVWNVLVPNILAVQGNGEKKTRWERLGCLVH